MNPVAPVTRYFMARGTGLEPPSKVGIRVEHQRRTADLRDDLERVLVRVQDLSRAHPEGNEGFQPTRSLDAPDI